MKTPLQKTFQKWTPFFLAFLFSATVLQAQTTWTDSSGDHLWGNAANWSAGLPGSAVEAYVTGTGGQILVGATTSNAYKTLHFSGTNTSYLVTSEAATVPSLLPPSAAGGLWFAENSSNMSVTINRVYLGANAGSTFGYNGSGNTLTVTGSGSRINVAYTAGFGIGGGNGTIAANSNNSVLIENGGALVAGLLNLGSKGQGNSLTVTGEGSSLQLTGASGQTNYFLNIGNSSAEPTNVLEILDKATATVAYWDTRIIGGSLVIGEGASLSHTSEVRQQSVLIGSKGTLYGAGTLKGNVAYASLSGAGGLGARAFVGETASDIASFTVNGDWTNANITLSLNVGDLSEGAIAGETYDFLDLNGTFVFGGTLVIDLASAVFTEPVEFRLIGWNGTEGSTDDLAVSFVNGPALGYSFKADGFYLNAVPEPATVGMLILGLGAGFLFRRRFQ